ncbi:MAG: UDP-N-acetylmuramoyl-L-alanyl-D-glutamate--2,6-diaminopimelate ligase [Candidatus Limnocylindrales bacterium]
MNALPADHPAALLADVLEAAEPGRPRPLGELVARLADEDRLRAIVRDDAAVEATAIAGLEIGGISDDSRRLRPGDLFVALSGARTDGHDRVAAAIAHGAVAAVVERPMTAGGGVQLVVERSATALGTAAAWWYGDPSRELAVVGVTGTDGKTTTSFLVAAALEAAGLPTGLIGTVETRVGSVHARTPGHITTPGALALQRLLRAMVAGGDRAAVIETTSHGLAAERVTGVAYDAAIFTNLSHEHLEFHGTFEAYRAAKLSLFERLGRPSPGKAAGRPRLGVVNADDPAAGRFADVARAAGARLLTYGLVPDADVRAGSIEERAGRLVVGVIAPGWTGEVALRLVGRFNVHNALAAVALGIGWELDPAAVRAGLEALDRVPGRMERIERGQPFGVIVDFAHSPAALQGVLDELGPLAAAAGGGLIALFGSAGERDTAKRPMMGRIAGERSRLVVVTDEDPRKEDRLAILDEIAAGAEAAGRRRGTDLLVIPDRAAAIAEALGRARPGDIVVLAGKGHEPTIEGPEGALPWDERAAAEQALAALGFRAGD